MAIDLGALVVRLRADMKGFTSGLSKAQEKLRTFSARLQGAMQANAQAMKRFGRQAVLVGLAVQGAIVGMVKKFGDFELAMRKATTATAITQQEFAELSKFVEEQATALNIAAVEAAEGIKFLGFAGLTATQQMQAFPPLLALSKAGMAVMGDVTEKLLGVMGAFQIKFDKTGEVADKVAKIWGSSQQTLEQLTTAFSFTAAGAAKMGLSISELGALTALMAEASIKGSRAGTTLRRTFLNLSAPTSELKKLLVQLNIATEDSNGKFRNAIDILDDFFTATENMGDTARASAFKVAFGARAVEGLTVVANKGIKSLREFADSVENADGTVDVMVERRMKALNEQLGIASREFGRLFRTIGQLFEPEARALADAMQEIVETFRGWVDENKELAKALAKTVFILGTVTTVIGGLAISVGVLALAIKGLGTAAVAAAASILLIPAALIAIKKAPELGMFFFEQFKIVQQVATQVVINLMKAWEHVKFGFKQMVAGMRVAWDAFVNVIKSGVAEIIDVVAKLPFAEKLEGVADKIRDSMKDVGKGMLVENRRELEEQLKFLDKLSGEIFKDIEVKFQKSEEVKVKAVEAAVKKIVKTNKDGAKEVQRWWDSIKFTVPELFNSWTGSALDTFNNLSQIVGDAMDGISDALTDMVMKGKADFNSLANAVLTDITRMIIRAQLARALLAFMPGIVPLQPGATTPVTTAGTAVPGMAKGGIVNPVHAASGFVARGTDTVPAMLTPGEMVIPKPLTDALRNQALGGGGGGLTINVQAIDAQNTFQFLSNNSRAIASMLQGTMSNNHPFRRSGNRV